MQPIENFSLSRYHDALIAYHKYLDGYSYRTESERKRIEQEREVSFDIGIQKIDSYTSAMPHDANGWLLRAKMQRAKKKPGWSRRCVESLTAAIEAEPQRLELRFYRGEIVARTFPASQLSNSVIVQAIRDLSAYLHTDLKHARGYRLLSRLYATWKPDENATTTHEASVLSARLADLADGRWRPWYRRIAAWGLLIACIVAMISVILLPRIGMSGLAAFLGFPGYIVGAYSLLVLLWSVSPERSFAPLFAINSRDEYLYDSIGRMERLMPPRPNPNTLRSKLDDLEADLRITPEEAPT